MQKRLDYLFILLLLISIITRILTFILINEDFRKAFHLWDQTDMWAYWQWGKSLSQGDWLDKKNYHPFHKWQTYLFDKKTWNMVYPKGVYHQAPLFPYLIAIYFKIFGYSEYSNRIIYFQLFLVFLLTLFIYLLLKREFGKLPAFIGALSLNFFSELNIYDKFVLREPLFLVLTVIFLFFLRGYQLKGSKYQAGLSGIFYSLSILTKPLNLILAPLILYVFLKGKNFIRRFAVFIISAFIIILPLLIRNYIVGAPLFSITTRSTINFIQGNTVDAVPNFFTIPDSMKEILLKAKGDYIITLKETIKTHPNILSFLMLQLRKFLSLFNPISTPDNVNIYFFYEYFPILKYFVQFRFFSLILFLSFFIFHKKLKDIYKFLLILELCYIGSIFYSYVSSRYRITLIIPGAFFLAYIFRYVSLLLRERNFKMIVSFLVLTILFLILDYTFFKEKEYQRTYEYIVFSNYFQSKGKIEKAIEPLERLLKMARENRIKRVKINNLRLTLAFLYFQNKEYAKSMFYLKTIDATKLKDKMRISLYEGLKKRLFQF